MQVARQLDPLSLIANAALGWVRIYAGQPQRAVGQLHAALELDPQFQLGYLWLGIAQGGARAPEAVKSLGEAVQLSGGSVISLAALAHVQASTGHADSARAIQRTLAVRAATERHVSAYELARIASR